MIPNNLSAPTFDLRPFLVDDAGDVFAYWKSDPSWERFNESVPKNFTANDAADFVAQMSARSRHDQPNWAIVVERVVVGVVSLTFERDHKIAGIGYGVHGNFRGRGLAAEAASRVITQAFSCYAQLRKIRAHTDGENQASMRVLEKLGFSHEGLLRQNQFVKGRFVDEAVFGLLREEWQRQTALAGAW